jgi:shikimate kinase
MVNQVFLVGYMGAGKTSVAKALSANSGLPMLDLDEALERQEGRTIVELFQQEGEAAFRNKERALLNEVAGRKEFPIVACGGGITVDARNVQTMKRHGLVVWIDSPFETILKRLRGKPGGRPLLAAMGDPLDEEKLRAHYELRITAYADCNERIKDVTDEVLVGLAARINREG